MNWWQCIRILEKKFIFQLQISLRNGRNFKMKKVKGEYHWQPNPHLKMEMSKSTNQSRCITPKVLLILIIFFFISICWKQTNLTIKFRFRRWHGTKCSGMEEIMNRIWTLAPWIFFSQVLYQQLELSDWQYSNWSDNLLNVHKSENEKCRTESKLLKQELVFIST